MSIIGDVVWWHNTLFSFVYQALRNPSVVGALSPCSPYVAREIVEHFANSKKLRILEVGAGTGTLSYYIVHALKKDDLCDIIEIDESFCKILRNKFGDKQQATITHASILDWKPTYKYDVIVCSLPFNVFSPDYVQKLLAHMQSLLKKDGIFSYIELMWLTSIKMQFVSQNKRQSMQKTLAIMKQFRSNNESKTIPIYLNFTPLYVHHVTIR